MRGPAWTSGRPLVGQWLAALLVFAATGCAWSQMHSPGPPPPPPPCEGYDCGHGTCSGDKVCTCSGGWSGKTCSVDPCTGYDCGHGRCHGNKQCTCDVGWSGAPCNHPTGCDTNPCRHGGACTATGGAHSCRCQPGWSGDACDHPTGCDNNPCQNGTKCIPNGGSHTCMLPRCAAVTAKSVCSRCDSGWYLDPYPQHISGNETYVCNPCPGGGPAFYVRPFLQKETDGLTCLYHLDGPVMLCLSALTTVLLLLIAYVIWRHRRSYTNGFGPKKIVGVSCWITLSFGLIAGMITIADKSTLRSWLIVSITVIGTAFMVVAIPPLVSHLNSLQVQTSVDPESQRSTSSEQGSIVNRQETSARDGRDVYVGWLGLSMFVCGVGDQVLTVQNIVNLQMASTLPLFDQLIVCYVSSVAAIVLTTVFLELRVIRSLASHDRQFDAYLRRSKSKFVLLIVLSATRIQSLEVMNLRLCGKTIGSQMSHEYLQFIRNAGLFKYVASDVPGALIGWLLWLDTERPVRSTQTPSAQTYSLDFWIAIVFWCKLAVVVWGFASGMMQQLEVSCSSRRATCLAARGRTSLEDSLDANLMDGDQPDWYQPRPDSMSTTMKPQLNSPVFAGNFDKECASFVKVKRIQRQDEIHVDLPRGLQRTTVWELKELLSNEPHQIDLMTMRGRVLGLDEATLQTCGVTDGAALIAKIRIRGGGGATLRSSQSAGVEVMGDEDLAHNFDGGRSIEPEPEPQIDASSDSDVEEGIPPVQRDALENRAYVSAFAPDEIPSNSAFFVDISTFMEAQAPEVVESLRKQGQSELIARHQRSQLSLVYGDQVKITLRQDETYLPRDVFEVENHVECFTWERTERSVTFSIRCLSGAPERVYPCAALIETSAQFGRVAATLYFRLNVVSASRPVSRTSSPNSSLDVHVECPRGASGFHIFLSYRRIDADKARSVKQALEIRGYTVFMDITSESLGAGDFQEQLERHLRCTPVVIALCTATKDGCGNVEFLRIKKPGDFVRLEIREALRLDKLLIPLYTSQAPGTPAFDIGELIHRADLPEDVAGLGKQNMVELSTNFFDASIDRVHTFIEQKAQEGFLDRRAERTSVNLELVQSELPAHVQQPEPIHDCPKMAVARRFVSTLGLDEARLNPQHDVCYCDGAECGRRHPDLAQRGAGRYALPKGWCSFGLRVDEAVFNSPRHNIWTKWEVAFHGTKVATAREILQSADWQLLKPGDTTPSGYELPIRPGHILPGAVPGFDPHQIFTSPSIRYCSYRSVYCDTVDFENHSISVAFQLRQEPGTYDVGPETVGAQARGETIDPYFENDKLEWFTKRSGVHKLTRLLVRVASLRTPAEKARSDPWWVPDDMAAVCTVDGCSTVFGFFEGRHHCRYCGVVVCKRCCSNTLAVDRWVSSEKPHHKLKFARDEGLELKEKKVCSSCFHAAPAEIHARSVGGAMPLDVSLEARIVTQDLSGMNGQQHTSQRR